MSLKSLERNKLDYILSDLLPVEISELFSFSQLYSFLLESNNKKTIDKIILEIKNNKAKCNSVIFSKGWNTKPLKYRILKGNGTMREMSIIQPLSALNIYLFMECYQSEILDYFRRHHNFSIRYHKKNTDLFYKSKSGKVIQYFYKQKPKSESNIIQRSSNYFKISPFESISSFTGSRIWRMCNFKYKYYAKLDYKSCFDSIYTHVFKWIITRNTIDSKRLENSNLFTVIDRILQNINGHSSNGIVVGPEFSRMIAEILLQHIDYEILISLEADGIFQNKDYVVYRYVDDIFIFANNHKDIEKVLSKYREIGEHYLLRINELKLKEGLTPYLPKEWLEETRKLSDYISECFFYDSKKEYESLPEWERCLVKDSFIFIDRIKDEITVLIKQHSEDQRIIVSFLLSTLLNNISKSKDGYQLFGNKSLGKAMLLLDLVFFIYAFFPSFEQTRKVISIIYYLNNEIKFKSEEKAKERLSTTIRRYSFIFQSGNIFDLCDWFPLLSEYKIGLDKNVEDRLIIEAEKNNNPIIWANLLLYSSYYVKFFNSLLHKIEEIVKEQVSKIRTNPKNDIMMYEEFWYILIFHNCPFLSEKIREEMSAKIEAINSVNSAADSPSVKVMNLIYEFLKWGKNPHNGLFNWYGTEDFSNQVTYHTYQRTIFKRYRSLYGLYASIE